MITLTKQQTYNLLFQNIDINKNIIKRIKPKTKYIANCLCCGKDILISYQSFTTKHIFCDEHKKESWKTHLTDVEKLIQQHYMRYIKEKQLKIVENNFNKLL